MSTTNTESCEPSRNISLDTKRSVVSLATERKTQPAGVDEIASSLLRKLQTSLDTNDLLRWFLEISSELLNSMNCKLTTRQQVIDLGNVEKAHHRANYNLTLEKQLLGAIEFSRNKRFTDADLIALETLMSYLIYPLRNALNYAEAVNASMSDALTGAGNKRAFDYQIHHEFAISQRYQSSLSLAVFDIDFFKKINDRYGHATGDAVLKQIVDVVRHNCRDSDLVFRLGGEEFGLLLTKTDPQGAFAIADRIRVAIAETTFYYNGQKIQATISMGISTLDTNDSKVSFIERGDKALYIAKNSGRNKTIVADASLEHCDIKTQNNNELVG